MEVAAAAQKAIRANLASLGIRSGYALETRSATTVLDRLTPGRSAGQGAKVDLVFLDPPYERLEDYQEVLSKLGSGSSALLAADALVVAEHARRYTLASQYGRLTQTRVLEQGDAALSFYRIED